MISDDMNSIWHLQHTTLVPLLHSAHDNTMLWAQLYISLYWAMLETDEIYMSKIVNIQKQING